MINTLPAFNVARQLALKRLFFDENSQVVVPRTADVQTAVAGDPLALPIFGHNEGLYGLPTVELIDWLRGRIGAPDRALEVGAGCGVFGRALNISSTDSFIQESPEVKALYAMNGQPVVSYGPNVERIDANAAVGRYRPTVVFGSWVTHKYIPSLPQLGGSIYGVDEHKLLSAPWLQKYIVYGNESVHDLKPIVQTLPNGWRLTKYKEDFMYSRSQRPNLNCVYVFERR